MPGNLTRILCSAHYSRLPFQYQMPKLVNGLSVVHLTQSFKCWICIGCCLLLHLDKAMGTEVLKNEYKEHGWDSYKLKHTWARTESVGSSIPGGLLRALLVLLSTACIPWANWMDWDILFYVKELGLALGTGTTPALQNTRWSTHLPGMPPLSDLFRSAVIFPQRATRLMYFLQVLVQIYSLHETCTDYSVENCYMDPSHPGTPASSYSDLFPSPWHVTRSKSPHDSLACYVYCSLSASSVMIHAH